MPSAPPTEPLPGPAIPDLDTPLPRWGRAVALGLPPLSMVALLLVTWTLAGGGAAAAVLGAFVAFLGVGSTIVFASAIADTSAAKLDATTLVALAAYFCVATTFFWAFNLELAERIPWFGPRVARIHDAAANALHRHAWIRRWATIGVALFVISPLPGSGTIGGSIVGRLAGLSRLATFLAVSIASLVVVAVYASFGGAVERLANGAGVSPAVRAGVAIGAFLAMALVLRLLVRSGTREAGAPPPPDRPA
jgi:hypothetical protein